MTKRRLNEAPPIDYGDRPERMSPDVEGKINRGETPLSKNPAFPNIESGQIPQTFEQLIASKRFKDVVDKVKRYTGQQNISGQNALMQLQTAMMRAVQTLFQIQANNKEYLENLAVDLVRKEMGVRPDQLQYDAKLVGMGQIDMGGFSKEGEEPEEEDIEQNFQQQEEDVEDFITAFERFDIEKAKRRFINALIQGSSKKGHYMFELVRDELDRIDPRLLNLYGVVMSVNDLMYWVLPDEMMDMMMSQSGVGGKEEVDIETDPPTVKARGLFFPILIHELIKGTMEVLGTQGLPDDPKQAEMVMASTDTLANEVWDLRLGPVIWEKFLTAYPERLFDEDKKFIQSYLFARFSALSADEFFKLAKMILRGDAKATSILDKMVTEIVNHLNEVHSDDDEDSSDYDNGDDDDNKDGPDDLDDFLNSLGIDRS
tara:strand:+ start:236 stop:1522 length:1287 start_codon:yes stop_codon:yes gene_type:complete